MDRFDTLCQSLNEEDVIRDTEVILPPVDVLMVGQFVLLQPGHA